MAPEVATGFWKQSSEVVKRLVDDYGARDVAMEVSYGSWITHFHAHVHILASNMPEVLATLRRRGQVTCDVTNLQVKKIYPGDPTVKLPFSPKIMTNNFNKFPLFRLCQDWFGRLPGFVVRIEMTPVPKPVEKEEKSGDGDERKPVVKATKIETETFNCSYWIRTDKKDQSQFETLKRMPPKGLQM